MYQIKSGVHGLTDISPVGLAAAIHLGIALHNFGIQEYMPHSAETHAVFRPTYSFVDGGLMPGEGAGLGIDYDDALAESFPYQAAYLPVNRLTDGTVHDW
jgi:mannonate dehydratase